MWSDVASAAETGWDFSTRWFEQAGEHAGTMRSIRTWRIVPVDLNAFMCMNSRMIASMYELAGNLSKVLVFQRRFEQCKQQMRAMHWNDTDGIWLAHSSRVVPQFDGSLLCAGMIMIWALARTSLSTM